MVINSSLKFNKKTRISQGTLEVIDFAKYHKRHRGTAN